MLVFLLICLSVLGIVMWMWWQKRRARGVLLNSKLTTAEREVMLEQVPLVARLPQASQVKLEGQMCLFLDQVDFLGCNELEVTQEMQISVAAQACLLVLHNDNWYKTLRTILIYPSAFTSRQTVRNGYVTSQKKISRIGESWTRGPVILSWEHSKRGAFIDDDGHNVVLHEFAHQLDGLSGYTDGAPVLKRGHNIREWERVFVKAYKAHKHAVNAGRKTVIDPYGAQAPEEFFAVSVEMFFEQPDILFKAEPQVFNQLQMFFNVDPKEWTA